MSRRRVAWVLVLGILSALLFTDARTARAQGPAPAPSGSALAAPAPVITAAPSTVPASPVTPVSPVTPDERPVRGPAVRDRGARRPRAGGAASGVLFLVVVVGLMGYYVVKRLRRYR